MALRETTVARLGLVALAVALWRSAGPIVFDGLLPRYPVAVVLLIGVYVLSFGVLLAASTASERVSKVAAASIAAFASAMIVFAFRDVVHKNASDFYPSTDGHVFMETAARFVLSGKNPYAERLGDAFRVYRMPMSHVTPFVDGDFTDRQAYPALSFLVLVPALVLRLPTYVVYALSFVAAVAIVVQRAPGWARPFIVAIFVLDESYSAFAYGGVTDTVWVLFLVGAVVWWRPRPLAAAVLVGLACAYKQHPWFLVPLLALRLAHERGERPWGPSVRRFLAVVTGVFGAVNIVFVLIGPHRWLNGVTEPLVAPMAQLSEGLSALSMTGWIAMPRKGTSLLFWGAYALAVFTYARHLRVLRDWCWVLPGIVLWFSYRALMSYWYFFALTAIAALFAVEDETGLDGGGSERSWRPTLLATGVYVAGVIGFLVWCATRPAPFVVSEAGIVDAWERSGFILRLKVENRLDRAMVPQFWVQSSSLQPLPWATDFGPGGLEPGESGVFVIRGVRGFAQFDITEGARVEVRDRVDPSKRAFVSIPGDRSIKDIDRIPNPDFRFMEARSRAPTGWSFESTAGRLVLGADLDKPQRVAFEFDSAGKPSSSPLAACVVAQHVGGVETQERRGVLSTVLPLPEGRIALDVNIPADANRPPFEKLYGVLLDVRGFRLAILLGEELPRGTLPNGDAFVGIAAPRATWTTVEFSPRDLLQKLGVPLPMLRFQYLRSPLLDFPSTPLELGLFAVAGNVETRFEFGRVHQRIGRDFEVLAKQSSEAGLAAWRAELDIENGNYVKAADRLVIANTLEPTRDRALRLGDAYLLGLDFKRARDTYAGLLAQGPFTEAESGLGFALLGLGDLGRAKEHLERARDQFRKDEKTPPRVRYVNALRGLARIEAKKKECESARRIREEILLEAPGVPPPDLESCN
ncbi:MAG: hypothetical protein JST00_39800 [Deltaproteobacteria bacterium]|nr:hypothetical protein [Deltaproteobacteria bacterium]